MVLHCCRPHIRGLSACVLAVALLRLAQHLKYRILVGGLVPRYTCNPTDNRLLADDKTPLICTPGSSPWVFYFASSLNATCPSCDFAERIRAHAEAHPPPYFITTYVRCISLNTILVL